VAHVRLKLKLKYLSQPNTFIGVFMLFERLRLSLVDNLEVLKVSGLRLAVTGWDE
jgi:hypothetical protein